MSGFFLLIFWMEYTCFGQSKQGTKGEGVSWKKAWGKEAGVGSRVRNYGCKVIVSSEGTEEIVHRGGWIFAGEEKGRWEWKCKEKKTKLVGTFEM